MRRKERGRERDRQLRERGGERTELGGTGMKGDIGLVGVSA